MITMVTIKGPKPGSGMTGIRVHIGLAVFEHDKLEPRFMYTLYIQQFILKNIIVTDNIHPPYKGIIGLLFWIEDPLPLLPL